MLNDDSLTKFRLTNHGLMIEVGRDKRIHKSERFCPFCQSCVEDNVYLLIK